MIKETKCPNCETIKVIVVNLDGTFMTDDGIINSKVESCRFCE